MGQVVSTAGRAGGILVAAAIVAACSGSDAAGSDPAPKAGPAAAAAPVSPPASSAADTPPPSCGKDAIELCKLGSACTSDRDCSSQMCSTTGPSRGTCTSAKSCTGGAGADLRCNGRDDCCGTKAVDQGSFVDEDATGATSAATVARFRLDAFEVTVGRLRAFFAATGGNPRGHAPKANAGAHPLVAGSGWRDSWNVRLPGSWSEVNARLTSECVVGGNNAEWGAATWTEAPGPNEEKPANCLDWYTLFAFCAWDGGRLPTDAEWSYVGHSGDEQRMYPWGDDAPSFETHRDVLATSFVMPGAALGRYTEGPELRRMGDGPKAIAAVGRKLARSRWGHADIAGNVLELVLDRGGPLPATCNNCASVDFADPPQLAVPPAQWSEDDKRIARGSSWQGEIEGHAMANRASRHVVPVGRTSSAVGGRCARDDGRR